MKRFHTTLTSALLAAITLCCGTAWGQGGIVTGVGTVNRGMAGAGTAAPLDAIGALHWNPASITALPSSEVSFGLELLLPDIETTSTLGGVSGRTSSESGVAPIPAIGWVHHLENRPVSIGLGMYGVAGFRFNQRQDLTNPILNPNVNPFGLGPAFAEADVLQIVPTVAVALSDKLSIGFAPTITLAQVNFDPLIFVPPGTPFPPGSGSRFHWGGGAQVGVYYITDSCWHLGLTVKSPQWFEPLRYNTVIAGTPAVAKLKLDYPMIVSLGTAYSGFENWVLAFDARYFNFGDTDGLRELGWSDVFSFAAGAQYRLTECIYLRAGYCFNQNPIGDNDAFVNVITPLIQQHNVAVGGSYRLSNKVDLNVAYVHMFESAVSGPIPGVPGSSVGNRIIADSLVFGVTVKY